MKFNFSTKREHLICILLSSPRLSSLQEDICSGLLKFHYSDGLDTFTENMPVQSRSTVEEILPNLITTFLPHEYQMAAIDGTQPTTVSLVQGKSQSNVGLHPFTLNQSLTVDCQLSNTRKNLVVACDKLLSFDSHNIVYYGIQLLELVLCMCSLH